MRNIKKNLKCATNLITSKELSTKIQIFFSTKVAGDDFDKWEQNFTHTTNNPLTIRGYVREISPEALIAKEFGLHRMNAVEAIVQEKHRTWLEEAERIVIDGNDFQVFRHGTGTKSIMQKRPFKLLRVILTRKD